MPRPRVPLEKAKATGRTEINPARFSGRNEPDAEPLGDPPDFFEPYAQTVWFKFKREIPWLKESDRAIVQNATLLRAKIEGDAMEGHVSIKAMAQLRICLSAMGATPADRSKITAAPSASEDPADEFFN
jgi:phage terminase small subunit